MVELLNSIARLWWDWTAAMFWQVGLLILLLGCLDLVIRKWAWPQLRYALWSLILLKLLLPPTLSLPSAVLPRLQPIMTQALRWLQTEKPVTGDNAAVISDFGPGSVSGVTTLRIAGLTRDLDSQFETAGLQVTGLEASVPGAAPTDSTLVANPQSTIRNPQLASQVYAMMVWFTGTLVLGIWLSLRLYSLADRHTVSAAGASLPQSLYSQMAGCAKRLGLRRVPALAVTKKLTSPAVFGVFRPVLLVPKGYLSTLSRKDTEHMLLHELAHIKRGDLLLHGLYLLLQIVYWYNPLLWLVRRQMHHLRELSCDATVAGLLREQTVAYRQTLLDSARRLLATPVEPGLGLLGLFEDSNRLLVRLDWLTRPTWRYRTMKRVTVVTIAALMAACVLPMAQGRESASNEVIRVSVDDAPPVPESVSVSFPAPEERDPPSQDRLSQDIAALQVQLEQLRVQQQTLLMQLDALKQQRPQMGPPRVELRREAFPRPPDESYPTCTVKEGDTLAGIARKYYGQENLSENIARIVKENRLEGSEELRAGQKLRMPAPPRPVGEERGEWVFRDGTWRWTPVAPASPDEQMQRAQDLMRQAEQAMQGAQKAQEEAVRAAAEARKVRAEAGRDEQRARLDEERARLEEQRAPREQRLQQQSERNLSRPYEGEVWPDSEALKNWERQMEEWGQRMEEWEHSPAMQEWQAQVERWAQRQAELATRSAGERGRGAEGPAREPMPPMPPMPGRPPVPALPGMPEMNESGGGAPPHAPMPESPMPRVHVPSINAPRVEVPRIEVPVVVPPEPPALPEKAADREEAVNQVGFGPLPGDRFLEVTNPVGSITVRRGDQPEYVIRGTVVGRAHTQERAHEIAEQLVVVTHTGVQADGKERIVVQKPEGLTQGESYNVALEITAPREVRLKLRQAVGDIRLVGLRGSVEALAGVGNIRATDVAGRVALKANVGGIDYAAPADLSAKVQAKADLGGIHSDLPLEVTKPQGFAVGSSAFGTVGRGEDDISLKTNTGSIRIRAPGAPGRAEPHEGGPGGGVPVRGESREPGPSRAEPEHIVF
jgi:beta-lactamase regulating signal transducer with metallopeptidase domain